MNKNLNQETLINRSNPSIKLTLTSCGSLSDKGVLSSMSTGEARLSHTSMFGQSKRIFFMPIKST